MSIRNGLHMYVFGSDMNMVKIQVYLYFGFYLNQNNLSAQIIIFTTLALVKTTKFKSLNCQSK